MKRFINLKTSGSLIGKVMIMIALVAVTSCEITPSDVAPSSKKDAVKPEADASLTTAITSLGAQDVSLSYVKLKITATVLGPTIGLEIRNATGSQTLATVTTPVNNGNELYFFFAAATPLKAGQKYRLYLKRTDSGIGNVYWSGANGSDAVDRYLGGRSSASGDFDFEIYGSDGLRDQFCHTSGFGAEIKNGQYLWQEFTAADLRVVLTKIDLPLSQNLESPENIFVDIRNNSSVRLATSNPILSTNITGLGYMTFTFPSPVIVNRGQKYQIYPYRSGWSPFPFYGVYWGIAYSDKYPRGQASIYSQYDFSFATDANGGVDQIQTDKSGSYPPQLWSDVWQEFVPGIK